MFKQYKYLVFCSLYGIIWAYIVEKSVTFLARPRDTLSLPPIMSTEAGIKRPNHEICIWSVTRYVYVRRICTASVRM